MKRSIAILIMLFGVIAIQSQTPAELKISIRVDTLSVGEYEIQLPADPSFKAIYLEVGFGDDSIVKPELVKLLRNAVIKSVDLVYTKYPKDLDLTDLNSRRIKNLHTLCPAMFLSTLAKWRIVAQTNCASERLARKLYHGFVIIYRPEPSKEDIVRESSLLKGTYSFAKFDRDSSVFKIIRRNSWKNMTVAADLTGSMAPYISQVLLWFKLTFETKNVKQFVFFNDGDNKYSWDKKVGKTGGLYFCRGNNKDKVLSTAIKCMNNGGGGDIQENNLEAVLYVANHDPEVKEIIMIADNWAPMRDYELMSQVKVPVHIVLCGVNWPGASINTQYLDLARHSGGSIHTIEEDVGDLRSLDEGSIIKLGSYYYKIEKGKFARVNYSAS